ncbi:cystine transport system permease protein [Pseudoxanthobacter soli DSM 19599]|uniref:Cystine transport system permease protein n=1 Tax=Pseudoxanthobacter soli DSM 19599 TaxID=1123029 RepID=A0A1M7Z740_9HYPH|nr:cystine ABC transporter permease [Pseudoxanthobacter soli]SHO60476.1 cystine transport system permease protein [Pseudoxanthobacter soli DSM 19599]
MDLGLGPSLDLVYQSLPFLLTGALYSIGLGVASMAIGLVIAFFVAIIRLQSVPVLSQVARFYVSFIRGTPLLVQLFLIYYGLPQYGITLDALTAALIGFSLNIGAYCSEILRGAIGAVDHGQWEAGTVIGMTRWQTLRRVILPQAARTALPPLGNSFIALIKDTSLAATIQVPELFRQAQLITARTFDIFAMYLAAAAIYWILSTGLAFWQERLEIRANRHSRRAGS